MSECVLIKTTLVDFPGCVASACFVRGCNLRCPYCYNTELVEGAKGTGARAARSAQKDDPQNIFVSFDEVVSHLKKRRAVLTGFVISGGEPLANYGFTVELIRAARALGYKIKLDTNGMFPERLSLLLNDSALKPDYIALDVKTAPARYAQLLPRSVQKPQGVQCAGVPSPKGVECSESVPQQKGIDAAQKILDSIKLVSELPPSAREFRTVLYPPLVAERDIEQIARALPADASWYFAQFRNEHCLDCAAQNTLPYTQDEAAAFVEYARGFVKGTVLR